MPLRKDYFVRVASALVLVVIIVISFDRLGRKEIAYRYPSGALKLKEQWVRQELRASTWYLPSGDVFRQTRWLGGTGIDYYLDDEGRLTAEIPHEGGLANGVAIRIEYGSRGAQATFHRFRAGVEVDGDGATKPAGGGG